MASSPIDGERPSRGAFRRSSSNFATIPQRSLSLHERAGLAQDDAAANVLFTHPNVRIYKFQPPTDALKSLDKTQKTLPDADYPIDAIEVLPWRARTEMLSAKGKMIIEKVQGSAHFLKAGDLIHTIMKNSQCWCVDGESRFVMRIGKLKYQRIEFPITDDNEKKKVEDFKEVISKLLKFEKTPCPFTRAFHVDLPEDAITPRRRGTWKRRESSVPVTPDVESSGGRNTRVSRTSSMRAMPPSSFPSRSMSQRDLERPRTASTPISSGRYSYPDTRLEPPANYTSGEENTDSDHQDSEPERPLSSLHSEADDSDREVPNVPTVRSPLSNVETLPDTEVQAPTRSLSQLQQGPVQRQPGNTAELLDPTLQSPTPAVKSIPNTDDTNNPVICGDAQIAPPLTTTESITAQRGPINTPSLTSVDGSEAQNDILVAATNVEEDKPEVNDTIERQEMVEGSSVPASTEGPIHVSEREEHVLGHTAKGSQASGNSQEYSMPAVDIPSLVPPTKESNPPAPSAEVDADHNLQQEENHSTRDTSPLTKAPVAAQPEVSPETSTKDLARTRKDDDTESIISTDSYHTLSSDDNHIMPEDIPSTKSFQHRRELSEMTVTAASMDHEDDPGPQEEVAVITTSYEVDSDGSDDSDEWLEPQAPGAFLSGPELRQRLRHRRSLSPLPPASILAPANRSGQSSPIPKEILQKAATLAVVKPIEAVVFAVHVLARIAQGATMNDLMSGNLFRRPGTRRTATGTFEQDRRGQSTVQESEDVDDFGFLRKGSFNKDTGQSEHVNDHDDDAASFASID